MFKKVKHRRKRYFKRHNSNDEQDDSNYYRCRNCGFICNSKYIKSSSQDESERAKYKDGNDYTDYLATGDDIDVKRGCPFCGTMFSKE